MTLGPDMFDLAYPDSLVPALPSLYTPDADARRRTVEFFAAHIRNANTRKAYAHAGADFSRWCRRHGILNVRSVDPLHVAAYIEQLSLAPQTVKQRLAALRALFDWLVVGQVLPVNPATSVRGPRHSVKVGKTPVLSAQEVRDLIAEIETDTIIGLRDRALIGVMVYLRNGGKLEIAQQMANHESSRTTGLYDRRGDQIKLDEVERIAI